MVDEGGSDAFDDVQGLHEVLMPPVPGIRDVRGGADTAAAATSNTTSTTPTAAATTVRTITSVAGPHSASSGFTWNARSGRRAFSPQ